jgi:CRP-like cAMP-binding protein
MINEQLLKSLNPFVAVSPQDVGELVSQMEVRHYEKNVKLTDIGETEQHMYFILNGLVRKFFYKGKNEVITHFAKEGEIISSSASFFSGTPSKYVVETLVPTSAMFITKQKLEGLYKSSKKWEKLGRIMTAHYLIKQESRQLDNIRYSTKERFVKFMNENPDLVQRVPQKWLASFLNIKPETFSRLKHSL